MWWEWEKAVTLHFCAQTLVRAKQKMKAFLHNEDWDVNCRLISWTGFSSLLKWDYVLWFQVMTELSINSQWARKSWVLSKFPSRGRGLKKKAAFCWGVRFFRLKVIERTLQQPNDCWLRPFVICIPRLNRGKWSPVLWEPKVAALRPLKEIEQLTETTLVIVSFSLPLSPLSQVYAHTRSKTPQIFCSPLQLMRCPLYCTQLQIRFCKQMHLLLCLDM